MAGYEKTGLTMNLIQDFDFGEHADQQVTELRAVPHLNTRSGVAQTMKKAGSTGLVDHQC